jgi:hypothetical protein
MPNDEQMLEKLDALGNAMASMQASLALLLEALMAPAPSPAASTPAQVKVASYEQMYGAPPQAEAVPPGPPTPHMRPWWHKQVPLCP